MTDVTGPTDRLNIDIDAAYRTHSRSVLATLIRLLGDFDTAEEGLHDAFAAATEQWRLHGQPANPYAWLVSVGRFKAVDRWRRRSRVQSALEDLGARGAFDPEVSFPAEKEEIGDDDLRLIFICCHPILSPDAQIALTLREVCGLTTEEIARAYLSPAPTIAQRIVRAKAKIRDEAVPYEVPTRTALPARLESVLHVIYLIFSEGYAATSGPTLMRHDLSSEAIRLGRLVAELLDESEAKGLLALMLLHEARREARTTSTGELVLLEDQDRRLWNRAQIAEGTALVKQVMKSRRIGSYTLQAAIAAAHTETSHATGPNWSRIVALYDLLVRAEPSAIVRLNRAAAIGMRDGPAAGLAAIDEAFGDGTLHRHHLAHAARADMYRRLGRAEEARRSYEIALGLARQEPERRFLERRIADLDRPLALPYGGTVLSDTNSED